MAVSTGSGSECYYWPKKKAVTTGRRRSAFKPQQERLWPWLKEGVQLLANKEGYGHWLKEGVQLLANKESCEHGFREEVPSPVNNAGCDYSRRKGNYWPLKTM
jgi:hypothetical protein